MASSKYESTDEEKAAQAGIHPRPRAAGVVAAEAARGGDAGVLWLETRPTGDLQIPWGCTRPLMRSLLFFSSVLFLGRA